MKVERKAWVSVRLNYDELIQGHLYTDSDGDLLLRLDEGLANVEDGYYYPAYEVDCYPNTDTFVEVGAAKIVIGEDND